MDDIGRQEINEQKERIERGRNILESFCKLKFLLLDAAIFF